MSDPLFKTYSFINKDAGLVARYALDRSPESTFANVLNWEARQENALSSRFGRQVLTTDGFSNYPLPGPVHTLARLKGLNGNVYRYAASGTGLYRLAGNSPGQYSQINTSHPMSGNRFSKAVYRPSNSSVPYIFFADSAAMLKDNGTFSDSGATPLQRWGILAPTIPPTLYLGALPLTVVDSFITSQYTLTNVTPSGMSSAITSASRTRGPFPPVLNKTTVNTVSQVAVFAGQTIAITGMSDSSFDGTFIAEQPITGINFVHYGQVSLPPATATGGTATSTLDIFVNTTVAAAIAVGTQTVTPASMTDIVIGTLLTVNNGLPDQETVPVTAVTGTTFTATFVNPHAGGATLLSSGFSGTVAPSTVGTILSETPLDLSMAGSVPAVTNPNVPISTIALNTGGITTGVNTVALSPTTGRGLSYAIGDVLTITGGGGNARWVVDSVDGVGAILTGHVSVIGTGYAIASNVSMTGGHGSGATINITSVGAGYLVGDTFTIGSGSGDATGTVTSTNAQGIVTGIQLTFGGTSYVSGTNVSTTDSGVGQGLTVNVVAQTSDLSFLIWSPSVANITSIEIRFFAGDPTFSADYYTAMVIPTSTPTQILVPMSSFTTVGNAGMPGYQWGDITGYAVIITTNGGGSATVNLSSFFLFGTGGPDSSSGGTSPYDYRITYYNINTGDESNPSVPLTANNYVSPVSQPILVEWTPSPDPQVTHARVYRRGGTLTDGWIFVAQIPIGTNSYIDGYADSQIASNNVLEIDNDVPVTSTLPVSLNATLQTAVAANTLATVSINFGTGWQQVTPNQILTVGSGDRQETVTVISYNANTGQFQAFFQFQHQIGEAITADTQQNTPVYIAEIAFQMAWLAGDPNNPHIAYYSKPENPEAIPPENTLEIGTPDQPIMAFVFFSGQLYVFTSATMYIIFAPGAAIPNPIPTSVAHGLASTWGICEVEGGRIWYQSYDGVYVCQGFGSIYASKLVEWLPRGQALGPVSPYDTDLVNATLMEFRQNEVFVSYVNQTSNYSRIMYDTTYDRWRDDDVPATALLHELDTDLLIIGLPNGFVYIDRIGDYDDGGWTGGVQTKVPIALNFQTPSLDQGFPKAEKVYQELTIDVDTNGQDVSATLLFDFGETVVSVSTTINTTERQQVQLPINGGDGQRSLNVALQVEGSITEVVNFYEWHIRGEVDAERRTSFDSYWQKYGTDEWKFGKQGWFEYETPGGQPITVSVYMDGDMGSPRFTFTLPAVTKRATNRIRFPAWKYSTIRFIATSPGDFKLYAESEVETKPIVHDKGYFHSKVDDRPPQEQ
jgi:hypothetical protein